MSLRDLRHAHHLTQKKVATALGMGQENVSRLEQRSDLLLSTLRGYVEALGGNLELVARFPDRPPVVLSGLAELDAEGRGPKLRFSTPSTTAVTGDEDQNTEG